MVENNVTELKWELPVKGNPEDENFNLNLGFCSLFILDDDQIMESFTIARNELQIMWSENDFWIFLDNEPSGGNRYEFLALDSHGNSMIEESGEIDA